GTWRGETSHQRKDGSKVYLLASTSFITDNAGHRLGVVSVNKDITERRQMEVALRESEHRFRNMADTAPAMLWTSDAAGMTTFLSRAWCEFTGQTEATGLGRSWVDALHPEDRETIQNAFFEASKTRSFIQVEYRLRQQTDGEYRWVISTGNPRYSDNGEFQGHLGSVIDVTERKKAEEDLRKAELLRMELDKEKELLQLKERFISVVSHEFRSPLAVIISSAELVHLYHDRMATDRQLKHVHEIMSQAEFMVGLLDDVLTVNKAQAGRLEFNPAPLNLVAYCEAMLERMQAVDKGKHNFVFTHTGDLSDVSLDAKLLQQILVNLLSNAIKYSPNGGDVRLEVHREHDDVMFLVSDQGIGIPADSLPYLYDPFYRANNTGDIGGTGLGTAIVMESLDLHKGTISCETEVDADTTFTVRLPASSLPMNE
ncbi:MAG: PAS domain-containing sensor histidine kinase, partial [Anaerolineae bacterium]|nr:PAS domain-containing sensor histidine kinase [Anaerolineae bacterium]